LTDYADWQTPQAHATAIFDTTVPLGIKPVNTFKATSVVAAASQLGLVAGAVIEQPSYQLYIDAGQATTAGTVPFMRLSLTWRDTASGFAALPDVFWLPIGQTVFTTYLITGPCRGDQVDVLLNNLDPLVALNFTASMTAISHLYTQARLIQTDTSAVSAFTQPGKNAQAGILASTAPNVTPGNSQDRLAAAWLGEGTLVVDNFGQANAVRVLVADPGLVTGAGMLYGTAAPGMIATAQAAAGAAVTQQLALPAGPVVVRIINTGATGNIAPTVTLARVDH